MPMITVSNALKEACNGNKIVYKEYIIINGQTVEIKGKMSNVAYKNTTFFGTFNMKMLTFIAENDVDYKKQEFEYYKEVNGESFKIGSYIVTDLKDNDTKEEITVTAMDYGLKFANIYETDLDYESGTITLYDVLEECCVKCGVNLANETIANGNFVVDSNQFSSSSLFGDVISQIALICGDFATINENDELELIFYVETNEVIEDYIELNDKRDTQPITSVSLGLSNIDGDNITLQDEELISLYGEHWLIINDCPFAYTLEKRTQLITAIFNKVKGFGYSSFDSKYSFKPYVQLGDTVQFKNKNGDLINSIILKIDTDYDDITLAAPSITSATITYTQPANAIIVAKRAEALVNQQAATIQLLAEEVTEYSDSIAEIQVDTDTITERVLSAETSINSLNETITTINEVIQEQTSTAITTWFNQSGIQGILDDVQENLDSNNDTLINLQSYIKESIETDEESPYYGLPFIELGKTGNETKLIIRSNRISFMTGSTESAYINQNQLYITDSTILNKLQVGDWEQKPDELGNLNMRFVGDET